MITRLFVDNFYTHMDKTFLFEKGLTGVIGPNESGKSLITEAIRYALFGSAALRSTAPKNLHVELDFVVKGVSYTVVRKAGKAQLGDLAIGTKPVNEAITKILGYDLQVFDVANSCNQGQVEALSDMRPTERKAMVDRTVGLDTLDSVIKYLGERGNALKSQAMGMRSMLVEPIAPVAPEGYRPSAELQPEVAQKLADSRELSRLQGLLANPVAEPTTPRGRAAEDLRPLRAEAKDNVAEFNQLTGQLARTVAAPAAPEACSVEQTVEYLEAHEDVRKAIVDRRKALVSQMHKLEPEQFTADELDAREAQHHQYAQWKERERLLAQGHLCCPACDHKWPVAGNIPEVEEVSKPLMSMAEIAQHRARVGNATVLLVLESELDQLVEPLDLGTDLALRRRYEAALLAYAAAQGAYDNYHAGLPALQARHALLEGSEALLEKLDQELASAQVWDRFDAYEVDAAPARLRVKELEGSMHDYTILSAALSQAVTYEAAVKTFELAQAKFERDSTAAAEVAEKSELYLKARMDVHALKTRIKSFLLPSLNKVASHLIGQMTGGARHSVEVNDDFEILIDGGAINTLSGSGKAVANLAIRIALGQILTNRVFSLFMADEVDGSMDADRADYVAQALQRLTGMVKQVILITHKRPETDHTIELKK